MVTSRQIATALLISFSCTLTASAQAVIVRPDALWSAYSPGTAFSAQVHAEANFLRAYGETEYNLQAASYVRAQAAKLEIENSVEYMKAYWERRSIFEAERMKRHVTIARKQDVMNSHVWKRLRDLPELSTESISNGKALNFLLDRLAGGVLAYQFSEGASDVKLSALEELKIDPLTLRQLRVRQDLPTGGRTVFRLTDGKPLEVGWWPAALRDSDFKRERTRFETARGVMMASPDEDALMDNLKVTQIAYNELLQAFEQHNTRSARLKSKNVNDHREFGLAKRYLQSVAGELFRIRSVGIKALNNDSLRFEGDNLIALLTHMSRSGLEFDKPLPGEESGYQKVFHMMRDLYAAVADESAAAK